MPSISRTRAAASDIRATRSWIESQVESYKRNSSDVHIKSNRSWINREIEVAKKLVYHVQSIVLPTRRSGKSKAGKLGGHPTCLSITGLWHELCDMLRRLVGTTAPGHHDCSIQE
ncbi:hypothetical protein TNCV_4069151 [Trichonephila clavipes]|nr:hypothetical protein TNCV_4069151 [Trichonephila clavipes]